MRRVAVSLVLLAACSSGSSEPGASDPGHNVHDPTASCALAATTLEIRANRNLFDRKCLAVPAGLPFTIAFDNRDDVEPHNIAIFSEDPMETPNANVLFRGEQFRGAKTVTYRIDALPVGTYHFHCDVHPAAMFGALMVA